MKTLTGDILDVQAGTILHQVNCRGALGGLAAALAHKHPWAFTGYFLLCDKYGIQNAGSVHEGHASKTLSVLHLFGQGDPGRCTDMKMVREALASLAKRPLLQPVYAPHMMGCGIGGGDWPTYLSALREAIPALVIVQLPQPVLR